MFAFVCVGVRVALICEFLVCAPVCHERAHVRMNECGLVAAPPINTKTHAFPFPLLSGTPSSPLASNLTFCPLRSCTFTLPSTAGSTPEGQQLVAAVGETHFVVCSIAKGGAEDGGSEEGCGGDMQSIGGFDSPVTCVDWSQEATASCAILCGSTDGLVKAVYLSA